MKFRIFCEVYGGVTGYSCAYLKTKGREAVFDSHDEAQRRANELNRSNNGPYATATFKYTVEDYLSGDDLLASHTYTGQMALDLD